MSAILVTHAAVPFPRLHFTSGPSHKAKNTCPKDIRRRVHAKMRLTTHDGVVAQTISIPPHQMAPHVNHSPRAFLRPTSGTQYQQLIPDTSRIPCIRGAAEEASSNAVPFSSTPRVHHWEANLVFRGAIGRWREVPKVIEPAQPYGDERQTGNDGPKPILRNTRSCQPRTDAL
ncbi:hypothetical protein CKAH01_07273 [Colletotrichum kahawae]|uniref:Uncharacterized protein n=1 Tax=Colletotrichum kahawae TaxID=34407 RepID=A0AAE0D1X5_COLKA|nr:hypothetical protein CKAH01_07273 [Colletotrichum kahawae]